MKKVFWDTNVLLDLIDSERPDHDAANTLLSCCRDGMCECQCSWHSLSIIDYVGGKKFGKEEIWGLLRELTQEFTIPKTGSEEAIMAFRFLAGDFEDAMQIASAVAGGADLIISMASGGFSESPVQVMTLEMAAAFLE